MRHFLFRPFWALTLLIFFLSAVPGRAEILQVGPAAFERAVLSGGRAFVLNGAGLKRFLTIKVVSVGLYLEEGGSVEDILADKAKRLEVVYLQNIPKAELDRATVKGIRKNVSREQYGLLESRIGQINSYYPDVRPQDRIAITYIPGRGTVVEVNGQLQGVIAGADFARAFFAIWLGDQPVDKKMKMILLGQTQDRDA